MKSIGILILSYHGTDRTEALLESIKRYDPEALNYKTVVSVEPSTPEMHEKYVELCKKYGAELCTLDKWQGRQVNLNNGMKHCDRDVVITFPDDVLITRNTITNVAYFWQNNPELKVAGTQIPCWEMRHSEHRQKLIEAGIDAEGRQDYANFYGDPFNTWYDGNKIPMFVGLNGNPDLSKPPAYIIQVLHFTGYGINRNLFYKLGGYNQRFYSCDEDISRKVYLYSDYFLCKLPSPPTVHFAGASGSPPPGAPPMPDMKKVWEEEWGEDFHETARKALEIMQKKYRNDKVNEQLKKAKYFQGD